MEFKLNSVYLQFNADTVKSVRKEYGLDKPGAMDQAIDILQNWTHKQEHFMKKDLPREYLERFIIDSKGSVEKAKTRIDRLYTMRTMVPHIFEKIHAKKDFPKLPEFFMNVLMPNMLEGNYRILVGKLLSKTITASACLAAYQHCEIIFEYGKLYDYAKGYYGIYDLNDVDVMSVIANIDLFDFRNILVATFEAYGFRAVKIFVISSSTMINTLIKIVKQCLSTKMAERLVVLKDVESLHEFLPKQCLPKDFGGEQKPISDLFDEMNEALCSETHLNHMEEMRQARTNEKLRSSDEFNREYLGMPGSFKVLSID